MYVLMLDFQELMEPLTITPYVDTMSFNSPLHSFHTKFNVPVKPHASG